MATKLVRTEWHQGNLRVGKTTVTPDGVELDDSSEEYTAVKDAAKQYNIKLHEKTVGEGTEPAPAPEGSEMTSDSASSAGSAPETNETPANAGRTRK